MRDPQTALAPSSERYEQPELGPKSHAQPFLVVLEGGISGELLAIDIRGTRIGRALENTVVMPDPGVSRYHALISSDSTGRISLTDQGSSNGTTINGEPLARKASIELNPGDTIRFGPKMVVRYALIDPLEERYLRATYERSVRDALTGLHNRLYFLTHAEFKIARSDAVAHGLAVILIDVDRFKSVNDTHGHPAGDQVLRELARILQRSTRPSDVIARYGGEEFIAALNVSHDQQAITIAERIRTEVAAHSIPLSDPTLSQTQIIQNPLAFPPQAVSTPTIQVTISLGVAFAPAGFPGTLNELITTADLCLYQAKTEGRNRVISASVPVRPKSSNF